MSILAYGATNARIDPNKVELNTLDPLEPGVADWGSRPRPGGTSPTQHTMSFLDDRLPPRFWAKCIPEPNSGCWAAARLRRNERSHRKTYVSLSGRRAQAEFVALLYSLKIRSDRESETSQDDDSTAELVS